MKTVLFIILIQFTFSRSLDVNFISENEWLYGRSFVQGVAYYNSISYGSGLIGESSLNINDAVDIDIIFTENPDSMSLSAIYSAENFSYLGHGYFPGMAFDISNPEEHRRINVAFFEQDEGNLFWDPDDITFGNYEYLLVMRSDYDDSGINYIENPAYNEDTMYFCWFRLRPGQQWFSSLPAKLEFRNEWEFEEFYMQSTAGQIKLFWEHESSTFEASNIDYYSINKSEASGYFDEVAIVETGENEYIDSDVTNGISYSYYIAGIDYNGNEVTLSNEISGIPVLDILNVSLVGNWNEGNDASLVESVSVYNDIWGYHSEDGTEYALIGGFDGTYIVDVSSNPTVPELVSFIQGSYSSHRDIKTFGNYMYSGTEANRADPDTLSETGQVYKRAQGIQVVDISDPENALLINEWDGVVQSHNIMEADGYLYVIGSDQEMSYDGEQVSWGLDDLIILDLISNPENPTKIGGWSGEYIHDVCVKDEILYACCINSNSVIAFDISDKTNPQLITQWYGIPSSHACWVSDDGSALFTASETTGGHIMSWDVTDLENVEYLDEWLPVGGETNSAHNIFVKDGYLYISYYLYGLQVLDVSDPTNLIHVGAYDTYLQNSTYIYNGAWGVYPYLPSGNILISDRQTGLYVLDFNVEVLNIDKIEYKSEFKINNAYPNPTNAQTNINFVLEKAGLASLEIINVKGEKVSSLLMGVLNPGMYKKNIDLSPYASGQYWIYIKQHNNDNIIVSKSIPLTILK